MRSLPAQRMNSAPTSWALLARAIIAAIAALAACIAAPAHAQADDVPPIDLAMAYTREVDRRLDLPAHEQTAYAAQLAAALATAGVAIERPQFVLLVDRSAYVQAVMVWWWPAEAGADAALLIGASPVSTGRPSGFEHFETPIGVFEHVLYNPDFRAEGTRNTLGIRGYGDKGMRVYDFGWVMGDRAWAPGRQLMRLQMHATDPARLEPRLGERASKGCIRIPATLNRWIDRHGALDAAYDAAVAEGRRFWLLRPDRQPTPWSGRWLVVLDSGRSARPPWSPAPVPAGTEAHDQKIADTPTTTVLRLLPRVSCGG
jgi:hypothetical protein